MVHFKDNIFRVLDSLLKKWKNFPVKDYIFEKKKRASGKPYFISLAYKEFDNRKTVITNGDIVGPKDALTTETGFFVKVMIGDPERGYGCGFNARDERVPRTSRALRRLMDDALDVSVASAFDDYLGLIGKNRKFKGRISFGKLSDDHPAKPYYEEKLALEREPKEILDLLENWGEQLTKKDYKDYITEVTTTVNTGQQCRRFVDSEGRRIKDYSFIGKIDLELLVAHDDGSIIPLQDDVIITEGWDHLKDKNKITRKSDLDMIVEKLDNMKKYADNLRHASSLASGQYPLILSPRGAGLLFHEGFVHSLSGKDIKNGTSFTFNDHMEQLIIPEFLTVVDNPLQKGLAGSYHYDEEGIPAKRVVLVEDGVLKNYLLDRDSAAYFGKESNGHSRCQWVTDYDKNGNDTPLIPEPRASNLEVISKNCVPDKKLFERMRKYCKDNNKEFGLYVDGKYGMVDEGSASSTGQIRLEPIQAWKVFADGRPNEYVTNFEIIDTAHNLLKQIEVTGDTLGTSFGDCGSDSGSVPTQETAPMLFIRKAYIQSHARHKFR